MNRKARAQVAQETMEILAKGRYSVDGGGVVWIRDDLERAREQTVDYPPGAPLKRPRSRGAPTELLVTRETTLEAAERLARADRDPVALNFASAKNPGGGFLGGSLAQEESLACASGLYRCIEGRPMYEFHRSRRDPMYTCYGIYSPGVPVFRDDEGRLLGEPYLCSMITSPAPNAGAVLKRAPKRRAAVRAAFRERIERVLTIGATHEHRVIILGAWGCGVFRNDPEEVAELFAEALTGPFEGVYEEVVFAIPGFKGDKSVSAFEAQFGGAIEP